MAGDKFLFLDTDGTKEKASVQTSAGAGDAGKIPALGADGKISDTMMPTGIGAETQVAPASEALSAGDLVNFWNDSGTLKMRKADASGGAAKKADGFVKSAYAQNDSATAYTDGKVTGLTSLTIGSLYYLSATPGAITTTIPTTAAHIAQFVGKAVSATELQFVKGEPIVRA